MRATVGRFLAFLALGPAACLGDLALVCLEPGAGLGVLPLPLLALSLEACAAIRALA